MNTIGTINGFDSTLIQTDAVQRVDWVVGLDLSLTSTGWATWGSHGFAGGHIPSTGHKDDSLQQRWTRLYDLSEQVAQIIPPNALVVIEAPSYGGMKYGKPHDRSGLWWMIVEMAYRNRHAVVEVPPSNLKQYVTGSGIADKDAMIAAIVKRYPDANVTNNDHADAVGLASMGARHLGCLAESGLPVRNIAAMDKVRWLS